MKQIICIKLAVSVSLMLSASQACAYELTINSQALSSNPSSESAEPYVFFSAEPQLISVDDTFYDSLRQDLEPQSREQSAADEPIAQSTPGIIPSLPLLTFDSPLSEEIAGRMQADGPLDGTALRFSGALIQQPTSLNPGSTVLFKDYAEMTAGAALGFENRVFVAVDLSRVSFSLNNAAGESFELNSWRSAVGYGFDSGFNASIGLSLNEFKGSSAEGNLSSIKVPVTLSYEGSELMVWAQAAFDAGSNAQERGSSVHPVEKKVTESTISIGAKYCF